jgi:hypothetical protein
MRIAKIGCVLVVTSCVAVLAGCSPRAAGTPPLDNRNFKKRVSATIFLIGSDPTACRAKVSPFRIQPKNNEAADWTVIDLCANVTNNYTETVTLTFTPVAAGSCGGGPIFGSTNIASGTTNFHGDIDVKCARTEQFTYTVSVKGRVLSDPELEIAP